MALIPCRECGKEVSDGAKICPYCGVKLPNKKRYLMRLYSRIAIAAVLVGACIFFYISFSGSAPGSSAKQNNGLPASPRVQPDKPVKEQIVQKDYKEKIQEMLDSGLSVREISKQTGIRPDEIRKIRKEKRQTGN